MPWDPDQWSWTRLPGGPRGMGSSLAHTATNGRNQRREWDQRMSKRDLARMGMVDAAEAGKTVLEIVEAVARGELKLTSQRLQAAIAALPYRHPRLISATVKQVEPFAGWTAEQLERAAELLERHPELAAGLARESGEAAGREPPGDIQPIH